MNDMVKRLVSGDRSAIPIATEEYLEIHRLCDQFKVPRRANDEALTAAQRVSILAGYYMELKGNRG